jgi:hypothetical protein
VSGAVAEGDGAQPVVSADAMHKRLFGEDDLSDGEPTPAVVAGRDEEFDFEHGSDSENEFVQGGPQRKRKRPARRIGGAAVHTDVQEERLTEAAEIFGDENNFLELMAVGRAARERGAVDEDIFGDAASTALSAEERAAMKRLKEERERQELLRKFEPAVLAEKHLTPTDELLKRSEAPERYARDFELQSNEHVAASLRQLYAPDDAAYAARARRRQRRAVCATAAAKRRRAQRRGAVDCASQVARRARERRAVRRGAGDGACENRARADSLRARRGAVHRAVQEGAVQWAQCAPFAADCRRRPRLAPIAAAPRARAPADAGGDAAARDGE